MQTFKTLLLREWMQHRRGWLATMLVPPVLVFALFIFSPRNHISPLGPPALMIGTVCVTTVVVLAVSWLVMILQAPGMARRDQQDRSIEFWLSLPTSHSASIGATLLMQTLLIPMLAVVVGFACSVIVGFVGVTLEAGAAGIASVPWSSVFTGGLATVLRLLLGVVMATLWISPILLMAMAASAWLKRWGVPVLIATLAGGHALLAKFYDIWIIGDTLAELRNNALLSIVHGKPEGVNFHSESTIFANGWPVTPHWLFSDAMASLAELADPMFLAVLVTSAACFALLVLRRSRA